MEQHKEPEPRRAPAGPAEDPWQVEGGDYGGESSQPLGVKLRAAQLSSPGQKQHTEVWAGWQKEPEAASRAQAGAGAVNELTHIPGVSTGAFLTIPLTDTPQFWMWELQGAKAGVPQP